MADNWPENNITALPMMPVPRTASGETTYVKQAPIDTVVFDEQNVSADPLLELLYEDLAGLELATVSRSDTVDGQNVSYNIVKNLSSVKRKFNPNNIIYSSSSANTYFSRFSIDLLQRGIYYPYFDEDGNLIIEIDESLEDEEIEVYIVSDGTIDEVEG